MCTATEVISYRCCECLFLPPGPDKSRALIIVLTHKIHASSPWPFLPGGPPGGPAGPGEPGEPDRPDGPDGPGGPCGPALGGG